LRNETLETTVTLAIFLIVPSHDGIQLTCALILLTEFFLVRSHIAFKMKFVSLAIAALLGVADAKKTMSNKNLKVLETRAKDGKINKQTLMRGATPYSPAAKRKLDDNQWEINGNYSVEFDACISLITGNEDLFDDDMVYYAANGLVKSERSYITFTVCESSNCYYQSDDEKMTFITDVATYFSALAEYLPNQVASYCEGCEDNYDYCAGNLSANDDAAADDEESEEEDDQDEDDQDGDRKLKKRNKRRQLANNRVVEYIDCSQCDAYECFADYEEDRKLEEEEEEEYDIDGAIEWLNALAECQELEDVVYENTALYAGLICNENGDGVEIAVFMDEDCSLYTTVKSFSDVMSTADKTYYKMSQEIVQYTFTNQFDCQDIEIEYTNPYQEDQDEEEEDEDDDGEAPEAAEYCADLFDNTADMSDCSGGGDGDDGDDDDAEDENLSTYEWYSYEISNDNAEDAQAVCKVLNGFDTDSGKSKSYKGKTVYDTNSSGSLYTYQKGRFNNNGDMSGGSVFAIVLFGLLIVGGIGFFVMSKKSSDSKRAPLINANNDGQMA
jgi:hypothetical protein